MLVRAVRHHREYAVRLALGARSSAILRDTVLEGLLFSLSGGLLGLVFAGIAIRTTSRSLTESMPRIDSISIDVPVALFTLGIAIAVGVLCSLVPAFVALRTSLIAGLKDTVSTATGAASHARLRSVLVVTEIGVALVLLIASLAFVRSYQKMLSVDSGFQPEHALVAGYRLPQEQYATDASVEKFDKNLIEQLSKKPGILAVGMGNTLPSSGNSGMAAYTIEGQSAEGWKLNFAPDGRDAWIWPNVLTQCSIADKRPSDSLRPDPASATGVSEIVPALQLAPWSVCTQSDREANRCSIYSVLSCCSPPCSTN